jgi:hypothetical protein
VVCVVVTSNLSWAKAPGNVHRCSTASSLGPCFALLSFGIGEEIYRCDILRVTNCD